MSIYYILEESLELLCSQPEKWLSDFLELPFEARFLFYNNFINWLIRVNIKLNKKILDTLPDDSALKIFKKKLLEVSSSSSYKKNHKKKLEGKNKFYNSSILPNYFNNSSISSSSSTSHSSSSSTSHSSSSSTSSSSILKIKQSNNLGIDLQNWLRLICPFHEDNNKDNDNNKDKNKSYQFFLDKKYFFESIINDYNLSWFPGETIISSFESFKSHINSHIQYEISITYIKNQILYPDRFSLNKNDKKLENETELALSVLPYLFLLCYSFFESPLTYKSLEFIDFLNNIPRIFYLYLAQLKPGLFILKENNLPLSNLFRISIWKSVFGLVNTLVHRFDIANRILNVYYFKKEKISDSQDIKRRASIVIKETSNLLKDRGEHYALLVASIYHFKNKRNESYKILKKLLEVDPENAFYWHRLGTILVDIDRPFDAMDAFYHAIDLTPFPIYSLERMGALHIHTKRFESCKNLIEQCKIIAPDHILTYSLSALFYTYTDEGNLAEKLLKAAYEKYPYNLGILKDLTLVLLEEQSVDKALQYILTMPYIDPLRWDVIFSVAWYFQAINDLKTALNILLEWKRINERSGIKIYFSSFYEILSQFYNDLGEDIRAYRIMKKIIELEPNNPDNFARIGNFLIKRNRYDEAEFYFQRGILINPKHIQCLIGLADVVYHLGLIPEKYLCKLELSNENLKINKNNVNEKIRIEEEKKVKNGEREKSKTINMGGIDEINEIEEIEKIKEIGEIEEIIESDDFSISFAILTDFDNLDLMKKDYRLSNIIDMDFYSELDESFDEDHLESDARLKFIYDREKDEKHIQKVKNILLNSLDFDEHSDPYKLYQKNKESTTLSAWFDSYLSSFYEMSLSDIVLVLLKIGYLGFQLESLDEAEFWFKFALHIDPQHPKVLHFLGLLSWIQHKPSTVIEQYFLAAMAEDMSDVEIGYDLIEYYIYGMQDFEKAAELLYKLRVLNPNNPELEKLSKAISKLDQFND